MFKGRDEYTFTVENVKKPDTPGGGGGYVFELVKVDSENGSTLSGAIFEIYASHTEENGNIVRGDAPLLTNIETGRYGRLIARIPHSGTYYYHEVKAPDGYVCDDKYYEFTVGNDTPDIYTVTMENGKEEVEEPKEEEPPQDEPIEDEPIEDEPIEDKPTQEEPKEDKPIKSVVPKTGDEMNIWLYAGIMLLAFSGLVVLRRKDD